MADGRSDGRITEREGRKIFQAKSEVVEATPERLAMLQKFRDDVAQLLKA